MTNVSTVNFNRNPGEYLQDAMSNRNISLATNGHGSAVALSEKGFRELEKAERNAAYLRKIEKGWEDLRAGKGIVKTFDELKAIGQELMAGNE